MIPSLTGFIWIFLLCLKTAIFLIAYLVAAKPLCLLNYYYLFFIFDLIFKHNSNIWVPFVVLFLSGVNSQEDTSFSILFHFGFAFATYMQFLSNSHVCLKRICGFGRDLKGLSLSCLT